MSQHTLHIVTSSNDGAVAERVISKPKARRKAIIEFIRSAERSLLLSVFRCDDLMVLHELGEAVGRGVQVEALVTGRAKGWGKRLSPLAGCLSRMGVTVHRFKPSNKYHAKFMVADDRVALIATQNLTRRCFRRTRDFLLVTHNSEITSALSATFRADLEGTAAPTVNRLIFGPGGSRNRIERILAGAQRSIRILDHKLSDAGILAILRDRMRNGVDVAVESGKDSGTMTPHGRLIIVDGAVALFGSFALTSQSLDTRRELAVIVEDACLVTKLERQFAKAASKRFAAVSAAA
jgi:cardiolipin synthase A/B